MSIRAFTSTDVVDLVGVTPIYLNALVTRRLYKIKPSISGRGQKVRVFDEDDLFGIALVWILFESGLRTQEIRGILSELTGFEADARYTAQGWFEVPGAEYLVITRDPHGPKRDVGFEIGIANSYDLANTFAPTKTESVLAIPIGARFAEIKQRIETEHGD
jgi:hypothetical protein